MIGFSRTSPAKALFLSALLVVACSFTTSQAQLQAACGEPGRARFNTNGFPQGYEGELFSAVHCYVEDTYCDSENLPVKARGSKERVQAFYGETLATWCTNLNVDFSYAFYNLPVSVQCCV